MAPANPHASPQKPPAGGNQAAAERRFIHLQQTLNQHVNAAGTLSEFANLTLATVCRSGIAVGAAWHLLASDHGVPTVSEAIVQQIPDSILQQPTTLDWLEECRVLTGYSNQPKIFASPQTQGLQAACLQLQLGSQNYLIMLLAISSTSNDIERTIHLLPPLANAWQKSREALTSQHDLRISAALVELVAMAQQHPTLGAASQCVVGELKQHLDCRFVALSLRSPSRDNSATRSKPLRLVAISGLAHFDHSSSLAQTLESAHDECVLRDAVTSWPPLAPNRRELSVAHRQIIESAGVELIVSTPLRNSDGQTVGALSVAGAFRSVGSPDTQNLMSALAVPIGSLMSISRRAQPSRVTRFLQHMSAKPLAGRRNLLLAVTTIMIAILCLPWPYRVAARCRLEPASKQYAVAPYDGLLETTYVQPGDRVAAGDPLARMEQREINWELASIVAQQERVRKTLDGHMAKHETPKAMICEAELTELAARRKLLQYQCDNMLIRAPVAGLVLSGSIERREHFPVGVGEKLYEIAAITPLRVEVAIPAEDVSYVQIGMQVQVRLNSDRLQSLVGKLESIRPRSVVRQQQNVFIATLTVDNSEGKLRPGMQGDARIKTVRRTLAWNWFHKPWERFVAWWSLSFT